MPSYSTQYTNLYFRLSLIRPKKYFIFLFILLAFFFFFWLSRSSAPFLTPSRTTTTTDAPEYGDDGKSLWRKIRIYIVLFGMFSIFKTMTFPQTCADSCAWRKTSAVSSAAGKAGFRISAQYGLMLPPCGKDSFY